ncbi:DUF2635 domain-containing protein [Achromobacter denitrificans]|uniref:DUF2635 domain-containing protein n=1 Tax=Achromobacter denitrificans TaxID=32002 RepID=A0ABZ3GFH5_ACHDE
MKTVTLKPAVVDGQTLKVRKPQGGYLSDEGEQIVLTTYWRRRRDDGDVIEFPAATTHKHSAGKATKTDAS